MSWAVGGMLYGSDFWLCLAGELLGTCRGDVFSAVTDLKAAGVCQR